MAEFLDSKKNLGLGIAATLPSGTSTKPHTPYNREKDHGLLIIT
jgi:hypothetical protein